MIKGWTFRQMLLKVERRDGVGTRNNDANVQKAFVENFSLNACRSHHYETRLAVRVSKEKRFKKKRRSIKQIDLRCIQRGRTYSFVIYKLKVRRRGDSRVSLRNSSQSPQVLSNKCMNYNNCSNSD